MIVWCDGNIWPSRVVRDEFHWVELALMLMQQQPYELDLAMLAAHLNDGRRVLHAGWILLMAMPINEETCKYKCVNGITMLHKLSEHCAYAHMRICACEHMHSDDDEPTRPCLQQGRWMVKVITWRRGLWRLRPNLFLLVSLDDELCFFYFPELGFTMMIGCATGFYEFAWLAASKERNKIEILNLFLLVSWTTMSYYFSQCGFSLWNDFGVWRLWCVSWLPDESFAEGEEYEYELASEPLLAPDHFYDQWSSPAMDFPSVVL